ncbi:MAG: VCBS repeat-containing protein [Chloroflexi bacterium]|nr:VCBS repeat-containing protein [Chloroflexota bacterium]
MAKTTRGCAMVKFRKQLIADERYESAGVMDVDGDGVLDIVSGAWWYKGPDFTQRYKIGDIQAEGEYYDDFSTIPMDVNGDDRIDFITGGWWGDTLRWRENPPDPTQPWPEHIIAHTGNVETTRAWDVDGDGELEIVPNCPGMPLTVFKLVNGTFVKYVIYDQPQGHGLGAGDIAGNGRCDFVMTHGWLEAPADPWKGQWIYHPGFDFGPASVPILVVDVDGDGVNDLIVGGGHRYGLEWYKHTIAADGSHAFERREIDPFNSQYHDLHWRDIDNCGSPELISGKRYRAHNGNDIGADDDYGIYYWKVVNGQFFKQPIIFGAQRETTGCGIHFAIADLRGTGRLDIVAPGKDGLYVFFNLG